MRDWWAFLTRPPDHLDLWNGIVMLVALIAVVVVFRYWP